jgi:4-diphosphocytidyl-2C-methyl-D-erythritol kinase
MADTASRIFIGSATVSFAPVVASIGGANPTGHAWGSDVGAILGGVGVDPKRTYHEIKSDHAMNILDMVKIEDFITVKFVMEESNMPNLAIAMDQASTQVTGAAPNQTLNRQPNNQRQVLAMKIVGTGSGYGGGSSNTRTMTCWKVVVVDIGEMKFMKDKEFLMEVTIRVLQDTSISVSTTTSQDMQIQDS